MDELKRPQSMRLPRRAALQLLAATPLLSPLLASAAAAGETAGAQQEPSAAPGMRPLLRIEAGMHSSVVRRILLTRDGKIAYTTSNDQTIRVWSLPDGQLLRVLRVPIGESPDGRLLGLSLSPDERTLACGGWSGYGFDRVNSVFLVDAQTGTLKRRISGLPERVRTVAISPDGATVAAGLFGTNGVRLYRVADGAEIAADPDYQDICQEVDFDAHGRLATVSFDTYVRLYAPGLRLQAKARVPGNKGIWGARFSPDGRLLAVSQIAEVHVSVFATEPGTIGAESLRYLFDPDVSGLGNGTPVGLGQVAWSEDGSLWAGGSYANDNPAGANPVRRWLDGGRGAYQDFPAANHNIGDLRLMPGGGVAFASNDPGLGLLDASGRRTMFRGPATPDFRDQQPKLMVDSTGETVAFGYGRYGASPARFSVGDRSLTVRDVDPAPFDAALAALTAPVMAADGGLVVTNWKDFYGPRLNGRLLPMTFYDYSHCFAVAPDRSRFVLGTTWLVRCFDRSGSQIWQYAAPDSCLALNVTPGNGNLAVAAFADGSIRWLRMGDGKELLALFPHADRKRWVLWTPTGYYACSAGGEDLIGWHLNRGRDATPDFYPASRFRSAFYRPDVVAYVLTTLDENEALRLANAERQKAPAAATGATVAGSLPPTVVIVSPTNFAPISGDSVTLKLLVRTPPDAPVTAISVRVDGARVPLTRDLDFARAKTAARPAPGGQTEAEFEVVVPVPSKDCEVAAFAENKNAVSAPAVVHLKWAKAALPTTAVIKPKLYVLAVGVGEYKNPAVSRLTFPAKDAKDFVAAAQKQKGGLYRDAEVRLLTDKDATHDAVLDGLEWIQTQTTSRDVAMVFIAGHGANNANRVFHFLPYDFDPQRFKATGVAQSDIQTTLQQIPGKVFLFLDTCDSGNVLGTAKARGDVDITGLVNELSSAESGTVVFCASGKFQSALEDPKWNNGAFTKALLEAMTGQATDPPPGKDAASILAALRQSGKVTIPLLQSYVAERVKDLTGGRQSPSFPPAPTNSLNNVTLAVISGG